MIEVVGNVGVFILFFKFKIHYIWTVTEIKERRFNLLKSRLKLEKRTRDIILSQPASPAGPGAAVFPRLQIQSLDCEEGEYKMML